MTTNAAQDSMHLLFNIGLKNWNTAAMIVGITWIGCLFFIYALRTKFSYWNMQICNYHFNLCCALLNNIVLPGLIKLNGTVDEVVVGVAVDVVSAGVVVGCVVVVWLGSGKSKNI